jgi:hypothetical protein
MSRRVLLIVAVAFGMVSAARADDAGRARGAAAYLNFALGSRSIAMGQAQAAVRPQEASALYANPATLALLDAQSFSSTTGLLGLDRSLYFAGYALPIRTKHTDMSDDMDNVISTELGPEYRKAVVKPALPIPAASDAESSPRMLIEELNEPGPNDVDPAARHSWNRPVVPAKSSQMAVAAGVTMFGIQNIEGRSEFGAPEANFQDSERTIYLSYGGRFYENLSIGLTGKYLGQTLQSASAHGFAFDFGTWYGVPYMSRGALDLALVVKDLGGSLKWKVDDPVLNSEFRYNEPVPTKFILGLAYTSPRGRWLWAMDAIRVQKQDPKVAAGLEFRALPHLKLRAGENDYNPTAGFGLYWGTRTEVQLDYAFQYDLNALVSPHWLTLSVRFLPLKS